ncbi:MULTISPECIES: DUF2786 domain-containing protein [Bacteroidales]|uniref:DUF2786 domain-containing protein n=1 Tax=Bacteroidales TaxID=171549 RepID=UPI0034A37FFF
MERITDKLRKLLALAERGCGGEAENARRLLEAQLSKYGLTLEDLYENKTSLRIFKYRNKEERQIIVQVFLSVLGSKSEAFKASTYNASKKTIYIDLTDLKYAEISDMVAFFKSQFNKEKKRLMKDILYAFVKKHNIFDCTPNDDDKASDKEIDLEELMRILSLSNGMEDVTYRKAISNK